MLRRVDPLEVSGFITSLDARGNNRLHPALGRFAGEAVRLADGCLDLVHRGCNLFGVTPGHAGDVALE